MINVTVETNNLRRRLLAAALSSRTDKESGGNSGQSLILTKNNCRIKKRFHLCRHRSVPRRKSKQESIRLHHLLHGNHRHAIILHRNSHLFQRFQRQSLRHLKQNTFDAVNRIDSFLHPLGQEIDVTVHGVIDDEDSEIPGDFSGFGF
ncbi:hypothetical protein IC582_025232 [Cucumis melo]